MNTKSQKRITCPFIFGVFGLICLLTGAGIALFVNLRLMDMWHRENFSLLKNSLAFLLWADLPEPIFFKVYIFNVTNPEEILKGAKPKLIEIGPYIYRGNLSKEVKSTKTGIMPYHIKNELSFFQGKENNSLKESDNVIILNVPLMEAYLIAEEGIPSLLGMVDFFREKAYSDEFGIFIKTSVKSILFGGLRINCSSKEFQVVMVCKAMEKYRLKGFRMDKKKLKFSFFHHKNGTSAESFKASKGYYDIRTSGKILTVNNSTTLKIWNDEYCNMINGSDGLRFMIPVNKEQKLYLYEKELCRSVYLEFEEIVVQNGTKLYKFRNTEYLLASKENNLANACFCRRQIGENQVEDDFEREQENVKPLVCLKNGALSLQPCGAGPLIASFPHFYLGDQSYIDYSGLVPIKKIHETYIIVEPVTGTVIESYKRFQLNMEIKKIRNVNITANLLTGLFPILWFEEVFDLSDDFFQLVQYKLFEKAVIEKGALYLMVVGVTIIIISLLSQIIFGKLLCCCEEKKF